MAKPFDATLKELIQTYPADWLRLLGVEPANEAEVLSPDLSAVTAMADTLLRVGDRVIHIDVESGPDDQLGSRMLLYNILAHRTTGLEVHSVAVLLRSNAKSAGLTGEFGYAPHPAGEVRFRFEVVRVWERPMGDLFAGGPGLLPLAVLGRPPRGQSRAAAIPDTLVSIAEEAVRTVAPDRTARIVSAALILAGMYVETEALRDIVRRFPPVIESSAYALFEELGSASRIRRILLHQGRKKFGEPTPEEAESLRVINDPDRLERMAEELITAPDWATFLKVR